MLIINCSTFDCLCINKLLNYGFCKYNQGMYARLYQIDESSLYGMPNTHSVNEIN